MYLIKSYYHRGDSFLFVLVRCTKTQTSHSFPQTIVTRDLTKQFIMECETNSTAEAPSNVFCRLAHSRHIPVLAILRRIYSSSSSKNRKRFNKYW